MDLNDVVNKYLAEQSEDAPINPLDLLEDIREELRDKGNIDAKNWLGLIESVLMETGYLVEVK